MPNKLKEKIGFNEPISLEGLLKKPMVFTKEIVAEKLAEKGITLGRDNHRSVEVVAMVIALGYEQAKFLPDKMEVTPMGLYIGQKMTFEALCGYCIPLWVKDEPYYKTPNKAFFRGESVDLTMPCFGRTPVRSNYEETLKAIHRRNEEYARNAQHGIIRMRD